MRPLRHNSAVFLLLGSMYLSSAAAVLRVPEEFASIQAAFDATGANDTVSIAPGSYDEFLVSPAHTFTLLGRYPADTLLEFRTLINPVADSAETLSVFLINSDSAYIENLAIFNSADIRNVGESVRSGGLRNFSTHLSLSRCRFDSVLSPIWGGHSILLDSCIFNDCTRQGVLASPGGKVVATNCFFETDGYAMVTAYDFSQFNGCEFRCNTGGGHFLNLFGGGIVVVGCLFGPCTGSFPVVSIFPTSNNRFAFNRFEDFTNVQSLIQVANSCSSIGDSSVYVFGNVFRNYQAMPPQSGTIAVDAQCLQGSSGSLAIVDSNLFVGGTATIATAGVNAGSSIQVNRNTFSDVGPASLPDIRAVRTALDSIYAVMNSFLPPGLAANTQGAYFDARNNWWGHSTGPYNASQNPSGQGAEVGNGVLFVPWLAAPPDSADTTTASEYASEALPQDFAIAAFPNPFNESTVLQVDVEHPGEYVLSLYDITGRLVRELLDGHMEMSIEIRLNSNELAAGVYFLRLERQHKTLAAAKLLLLK